MNIQLIGTQQTNALAFQAKLPTEDVIQVAIRRLFSEGRGHDLAYDVCEGMTNRSVRPSELYEARNRCQLVLLNSIPVLRTIKENAGRFFDGTRKTAEEMRRWISEQVALVGSREMDVPEFAVD